MRRLWTAPRLSGPSEIRSSRPSGNARSSSKGSPELWSLPHGREEADRLVAQASKRDLQHRGRSRVEPLRVVERDQHRPLLGKYAQDVEHGQPDRVRIRCHLARLGQHQRDLERAPSRGRKRGPCFHQHAAEQIGESGEGKRRLGLDTVADQHPAETLTGILDACLPEDRLPNPRLAGKDESARTILDSREERLDVTEFVVTSDDRGRRHELAPIVTCNGRREQVLGRPAGRRQFA